MYYILKLVFIFLFSSTCLAESDGKFSIGHSLSISKIITIQNNVICKSGCCSWHEGVCGCRNGMQLCCDGTTSPTCSCGEFSKLSFVNENLNEIRE